MANDNKKPTKEEIQAAREARMEAVREARVQKQAAKAARKAERESAAHQNKKNFILNCVFALIFGTTAVVNLFKAQFNYTLLFGIIAAVNVFLAWIYYKGWKG